MRATLAFVALATMRLVSGASLEIESPESGSSFHAGDEVNVRWSYVGTGEYFSMSLLKGEDLVADLCEAEKDGLCFDLTQDQTVVLPSGISSGSDYTITVEDAAFDAVAVSDPFTVIGDPYSNIEVIAPDGESSLNAGEEVEVEWLYVGENSLFDIYIRQGDGYMSLRVSDNLCGSEADGSCRASAVGRVTVTLPKELEDADDYALLVVDREDDDAYGMSPPLSIAISTVSTRGDSTEMDLSTSAQIGIIVAIGVAGFCACLVMAICVRRKKQLQIQQDKMATLKVSQQRRPAPTVNLAVEDMQQPISPAESEDASRNFINPLYSTSQEFYDGQITPPPEDTTLWRRSRDVGRYVGRQISQTLSRSLTNIED